MDRQKNAVLDAAQAQVDFGGRAMPDGVVHGFLRDPEDIGLQVVGHVLFLDSAVKAHDKTPSPLLRMLAQRVERSGKAEAVELGWRILFDSVHVSTKNLGGHDAPCSLVSLQNGFTGPLLIDYLGRASLKDGLRTT